MTPVRPGNLVMLKEAIFDREVIEDHGVGMVVSIEHDVYHGEDKDQAWVLWSGTRPDHRLEPLNTVCLVIT